MPDDTLLLSGGPAESAIWLAIRTKLVRQLTDLAILYLKLYLYKTATIHTVALPLIVMRQYIISILFVQIFNSSVFSQRTISDVQISKTDNLQSDSINTSDNAEFEIKAGLKPIDQTQHSYEIRFYKTEELSGVKTLKVLYSTDKGWIAKRLTDLRDSVKVETLNMKDGQVRAASRVLFNSNLGYLPDQKRLEAEMKKPEIINGRSVVKKHLVSDGQSYAIEFKHLDVYRVYRFNNPDIYSKLYPDIQEFKDYLSIVDIFERMVK